MGRATKNSTKLENNDFAAQKRGEGGDEKLKFNFIRPYLHLAYLWIKRIFAPY